jgi:flagellar biosynthesis/type III secretory pathway protein FliH
MTAPLARYLQDFSAPRALPAILAEEDFAPSFSFEPAPSLPSIEIDLEAERAEAFAAGKAEAEAAGRAAWETERAELQRQHAEEMAALRRSLESEALLRIEAGYAAAAERIAATVSDRVAEVLAPVMQDALATKATQKLAAMIRSVMQDGSVGQLTVKAPAALFETLKKALGDTAPDLRHIETTDLDISVDIDEAVLVTRMSAWAGSLKKVLG